MEFEGILTSWDDDRGFGFLEPSKGGQKIFAHIKSFKINGRPQVNKVYRFEVQTNEQGKKRAINIKPAQSVNIISKNIKKPNLSNRNQAAQWGTATLFSIPAFVLIYLLCLIFLKVPKYTFLVYIILSTVSFAMYSIDKSAAEAGRRRIPEANLHLLAILSGWPGGLVAQQILRHKSIKQEFRQTFWRTVVMNIIGFIAISAWSVSS